MQLDLLDSSSALDSLEIDEVKQDIPVVGSVED
jgi:hypothetical protein